MYCLAPYTVPLGPKNNPNTLTTEEICSGQRFAILAMFFRCLGDSSSTQENFWAATPIYFFFHFSFIFEVFGWHVIPQLIFEFYIFKVVKQTEK